MRLRLRLHPSAAEPFIQPKERSRILRMLRRSGLGSGVAKQERMLRSAAPKAKQQLLRLRDPRPALRAPQASKNKILILVIV